MLVVVVQLFVVRATAAVCPHGALHLRRRRVQRERDQRFFVLGVRDPRDCAHLGVAQPSGREMFGDQWELTQRVRNPQLLLSGSHVERTVPAQPVRARTTPPLFVTTALVEFRDKEQPTTFSGCEVSCELGDLGFDALQRHRLRNEHLVACFPRVHQSSARTLGK